MCLLVHILCMQHKLAEFVVAIAGSSAYIHLWLVLRRV